MLSDPEKTLSLAKLHHLLCVPEVLAAVGDREVKYVSINYFHLKFDQNPHLLVAIDRNTLQRPNVWENLRLSHYCQQAVLGNRAPYKPETLTKEVLSLFKHYSDSNHLKEILLMGCPRQSYAEKIRHAQYISVMPDTPLVHILRGKVERAAKKVLHIRRSIPLPEKFTVTRLRDVVTHSNFVTYFDSKPSDIDEIILNKLFVP